MHWRAWLRDALVVRPETAGALLVASAVVALVLALVHLVGEPVVIAAVVVLGVLALLALATIRRTKLRSGLRDPQ